MKPKVDYHLDLRGAIPPISLLKVTQVFRRMKADEILEIIGRDPDTRADLFKVLPEFSYELINFEEMGKGSTYRVQMKKRGNM